MRNRQPSEDPLIFAIATGTTIGADILDRAIAYRESLRVQLEEEVAVLEAARVEAIAAAVC